MKNGRFENQAEIYQALLDGKKIKTNQWGKGCFVHLIYGNLVDEYGHLYLEHFSISKEWSLYQEPKPREILYEAMQKDVLGEYTVLGKLKTQKQIDESNVYSKTGRAFEIIDGKPVLMEGK